MGFFQVEILKVGGGELVSRLDADEEGIMLFGKSGKGIKGGF